MTDDPYVFLDAPATDPAAGTIFLLHGTGGNERQFFEVATELSPGARRVAPRGDVSEHGALRYFKRHAEGRFDMPDLARATRKLTAFIAAQATTGPRPILGLGYSNGANILAAVQFAAPELVESAALLHPLIPFTPQPQPGLAGKHVLITAGRRDPICPPERTQWLADWYRTQGAELTLFWHDGGHEIRQEELRAVQAFLAA